MTVLGVLSRMTHIRKLVPVALVLLLSPAIACMDPTSPRDEWAIVKKYCRLRGDTMVLHAVVDSAGKAKTCAWVIRDQDWCDTVPRVPVDWPVCVVGQPYRG